MIDLYNLKMNDVEFNIDKEKRTITCSINGTRTMFYDFLNTELLNFYNPVVAMNPSAAWKTCRMPDSFFGKAVCAEEDEWNETIGKTIAFDRMKRKIANSFANAANRYANVVDRQINESYFNIQAYCNRLGDNARRRGEIVSEALENA